MTILDTRRAKINGLFPVKVQVVFRRKQKYYSTGKELSKEDWDRLLKAKSQLLMEVRTDIESSFSIIKQQVSELIQKGEFRILPPSMSELHRRLEGRGTESPEQIAMRQKIAVREIALKNHYRYNVINDDVAACAARIAGIIEAERYNTARYTVEIPE